jgi:hypothetical protein
VHACGAAVAQVMNNAVALPKQRWGRCGAHDSMRSGFGAALGLRRIIAYQKG